MNGRALALLLLSSFLPLAARAHGTLVDLSVYDLSDARRVIASSRPRIARAPQPFPGAVSTFAPDPPG